MNRQKITLVSKTKIVESVFLLGFETEEKIQFEPGQFLNLTLKERLVRSYSIVETEENFVSLLIDTKIGGEASEYFNKISLGDKISCIGPAGKFVLRESANPKVFVATGTGITPFIPMIKKLLKNNPEEKIHLFFGAKTPETDYSGLFLSEFNNLTIHSCFSQVSEKELVDQLQKSWFAGRVTSAVPKQNFDFQNTDFYLCGKKQMVDDTNILLGKLGATNIYFEKY